MTQVEVPHLTKLNSETQINSDTKNIYSLLLKVHTPVNSYIAETKELSQPETFYQSTKFQKVPLSVTLKNTQVIKELSPKLQVHMLPLLVTLKMVPKQELDYHLVAEKLSQDYVDAPLVSLPEVVELINQF